MNFTNKLWKYHTEDCSLCGKPAYYWLSFDFLRGRPRICEPCLYRLLTGKSLEWRDDVQEVLTETPCNGKCDWKYTWWGLGKKKMVPDPGCKRHWKGDK